MLGTRVINSVREKLARAAWLMRLILKGRFDYLRYAVWVRWKGLDFNYVSLERLGFSPSHSVHHSPSGGVFLSDVLKEIDIPPGSRVVDLGCGKGSALCTLAQFPFELVAGVELSVPLARAAEANARKLGLAIQVHRSDAAEFQHQLDQFSHIYMFNPFPNKVMRDVMKNVAASLIRRPRQLTVIYHFPVCGDVVANSGLFTTDKAFDVGLTHPYRVFVHPAPPGRDPISMAPAVSRWSRTAFLTTKTLILGLLAPELAMEV